MLPTIVIVADFHLRPFVDIEDELHGVRGRDPLVGRLHRGELPAVLREQFLDHHLGALDFRGIELAFDREPDLFVLERIQDVRFGDRFIALVLDAPDDRPLGHVEKDDFPVGLVGAVLALRAECPRKIACSIAPGSRAARLRGYRIAGTRKNAREQRVALDSADSDEFDALDHVLLRGIGIAGLLCGNALRDRQGQQRHNHEKLEHARKYLLLARP